MANRGLGVFALVFLGGLALASASRGAPDLTPEDRRLVGSWKGGGLAGGREATAEATVAAILDGRFLRMDVSVKSGDQVLALLQVVGSADSTGVYPFHIFDGSGSHAVGEGRRDGGALALAAMTPGGVWSARWEMLGESRGSLKVTKPGSGGEAASIAIEFVRVAAP
jgi:hypothetical protein